MKPTVEEVKEHFKDAKLVKCLEDGIVYDINKEIEKDVYYDYRAFWIVTASDVVLLHKDGEYAEIIEYKKPKQMKYTLEQIAKHGKLMQEYAKDQSIKIEFSLNGKEWCSYDVEKHPCFQTVLHLRKKPEPLFINELGEEFTQQDGMDNIAVFQYHIENKEICINDIVDTFPAGDKRLTEISKTEQGALKLAINKLNK